MVFLGTVLALAALAGACTSSDEDVQSNGEEGALFLGHTSDVGNPCGSSWVAPSCDYISGCDILSLRTGFHDLQVSRWVRVRSGNGLGDSNTVSDYRDLGPSDEITVKVSPPDAATVENVEYCPDAVRFSLTINRLSPFDLSVSTKSYSDRWTIDPVDSCDSCY